MSGGDTDEGKVRTEFGQRLKIAREKRELTQQQVADRFGVGKGTVSAWETGRGAPDAFTLRALSRLYDVSADELLGQVALSASARKIAAEYDALPFEKREAWRVLWLGFISGASQKDKPDAVEAPGPHRPVPPPDISEEREQEIRAKLYGARVRTPSATREERPKAKTVSPKSSKGKPR